ncbi:hypothetical protein CHUAL_008937 [Chamberlinius hualienensis]
MAKKLFCFIFCAQFVLKVQTEEQKPGIKVDNCIFKCETYQGWFSPVDVTCNVNCNQPTTFIDKNYNVHDVVEKIENLNSATKVKWVKIASNNIFGFSTNYFCTIDEYHISRLRLFKNKLNDSSQIGLGDINKCGDENNNSSKCDNMLMYLNLGGNPLKILKNNSFCHLKNLTVLDLIDCSLNSIEIDAFKLNNKLQELYLEDNRLAEIPYLGHLTSLIHLDIRNSLLTTIKDEDFIICNTLVKLDLSRNRINYIEDNAFDHLTNLKELDVSYNLLKTISKAFNKVNVSQLNFNNNLLIEFSMFDFSNNLKYLYAMQNVITNIPANITNSQLIKIDLSRNNINLLEKLELPMTLERIDLDENNIEYFSLSSQNTSHKLKNVNLQYNRLEIVSNDGLKANIYNLNGNPLLCSCENSWLFSNSEEANSILDEPCLSNNKYNPNHQSLLNVNMLCESNFNDKSSNQQPEIDFTWKIIIGIIAPMCVFAIVYGVIRYIQCRLSVKHVKCIERAYRLMKNAGTPIETDGKVFDVFISYSNEDSEFVATEIVPKLEDITNPYHVCVHERNFLGGGSIEDTIIEAIKKSTRIIVILTENYMKSDWCMYEFVIAHSVMIEDQCPRVVLIIKDELPADINPNLQIYLTTNTYIKWTDPKFWQRMHFALHPNKLPIEQTLQPMKFLMATRFITPYE